MNVRQAWQNATGSGPRLRVWIIAALCAALIITAPLFVLRVRAFLAPVLPIARLAFDPSAQALAAHTGFPYRALVETNRLLPTDARVLLVTDGQDLRHFEYTTFHRALYYLSPRAVSWMSPAPRDGTWESRWWEPAPLTFESILRVAHAHRAQYILLIAAPELGNTTPVARWDRVSLYALDSNLPLSAQERAPEFTDSNGWWKSIFALVTVFCLGAPITFIANSWGFQTGQVETLALVCACGAGILAFGMLALSIVGLPLTAQVLLLALIGLCGVLWTLRRSRHLSLPRFRLPLTALEFVLLVWLTLQIAYITIIALGQPLVYWDSWVVWGMKARAMFLAGGITPTLFADPSRAVTHLDYPLLLPSLQAWLYQWLGAPDDRFAGEVTIAFYLALLGLAYGAARRLRFHRTHALFITTLIGALPTITLLTAEVYADIPLAAYISLTTFALLEWVERGARGTLVLALIGAACLPWLKREGIIYVFALGISILFLGRHSRRASGGVLACLVTASIIGGGWSLYLHQSNADNTDFLPVTLDAVGANMNRLPTILVYFAQALSSYEWCFVWLFVLPPLVKRLFTPRVAPTDVFLLAPLLYLAIMATSYLFSAYTPLTEHLASSGYRLIAHVTPLVVLWLGVQVFAPQSSTERVMVRHASI